MKSFLSFCIVLFCFVDGIHAQIHPDPKNPENANLEVPANWIVRPDHTENDIIVGSDADSADIFFVNMVPGWHITTGPAAIFYHQGSKASGMYRTESEIHLFKPNRDREAFGIFIGGSDLEGESQAYSYFLIRNTGEYLIKNRNGSKTDVIVNWTAAPMMTRYTDPSKSSVKNVFAIEVGEEMVDFYLNDEKLTAIAKDKLHTEGIVGLRVNHSLNVHVEDLNVTGL